MKPLYRYSIREAKESNQLPLWRESHAENKRCRDFLDELIKDNWDGMQLDASAAKNAVDEFGYDRTMWVLANHLQHNKRDARFSTDNREWAKTIYIPDRGDHSSDYLLQSHSEKINELTDRVLKLYDGLNMFDHRHCIPDSKASDYSDKILIVRADWLNENYKEPKYQLFRAGSGFGCSPTASGRAVFGEFLYDGEKTRFDRGDFVGVIDDQYLPEWAKEKLQLQSQTASDEQDEGSQPVMKGI